MNTLDTINTLETRYGVLKGLVWVEYYSDGCVESCTLEVANPIQTPCGTLVPQYEEDPRRKQSRSLSFYPDGSLRSIVLQDQQVIQTSIGAIPAEQILFYPDGQIKRIFPLNGKITGFWTVENEYELATEIDIQTPVGQWRSKLLAAYFYPDGALKSLTFWPQDSITIETPIGAMEIRTGVSFYPQGAIRSVEPKHPTLVKTPIGEITAFHANVHGIHGDSNSLRFSLDGQVCAIATSSDRITITDPQGHQLTLQPGLQPSCNIHIMDVVPLSIEFLAGKVRFNSNPDQTYDLTNCAFEVTQGVVTAQERCEAVSG